MEKYIYLDRENAKKGIALVFAAKDHPVKDYPAYFGGEAIEFVGEDLPHYITYVQDGDKAPTIATVASGEKPKERQSGT